LWDAKAWAAPRRPKELTAREIAARWADLIGEDAGKAFRSLGTLTGSPQQAVALVRDRLQPVVAAAPERTAPLLAALGSRTFAEREKARRKLEELGVAAEPALRKALEEKIALEVRRRIEELLGKLEREQKVRVPRSLELLERVGTPEARRFMEKLAGGAPEAWLTQQARATFQRLAVHSP
jgi:hypothetical protein